MLSIKPYEAGVPFLFIIDPPGFNDTILKQGKPSTFSDVCAFPPLSEVQLLKFDLSWLSDFEVSHVDLCWRLSHVEVLSILHE